MAGNLNALGLILVILPTAAMLARYGARPRSLWQVVGGVAASFVVLVFISILTASWLNETTHSHQILIPLICLVLLLIFTNPSRVRATAVAALVLSMLVLSTWVDCLVTSGTRSGTRYTGNPEWARQSCRAMARSNLGHIQLYFSEASEQDGRSYPAGWLTETELGQELSAEDQTYTKARSVEIRPFWHSVLTGLYGKTYHELYLWYPGGRLKDGLAHLEFRPR